MVRGRRWTQKEIMEMTLLRAQGLSWAEVAEKMGRPEGAVKTHASRLGLPEKVNVTKVTLIGPHLDAEAKFRSQLILEQLEVFRKLLEDVKAGQVEVKNGKTLAFLAQSVAALSRVLEAWQTGKEQLVFITESEGDKGAPQLGSGSQGEKSETV